MINLEKELQKHFEKLMAVPIDTEIKVVASKQIKLELKMLLAISKMFEKININDLFKLYEERGGSKKDIETFLRQ